jgi:hypothetical protein
MNFGLGGGLNRNNRNAFGNNRNMFGNNGNAFGNNGNAFGNNGNGNALRGAHRPQEQQFLFLESENKDIKSYVIAAVLVDPFNFKHCSQRLKGDKDVLLAALRSDVISQQPYNRNALNALPVALDHRMIVQSVLQAADKKLLDDPFIIRLAITKNALALLEASTRLQMDEDMCALAVGLQSSVYAKIHPSMQSNRVVIASLLNAMRAFRYGEKYSLRVPPEGFNAQNVRVGGFGGFGKTEVKNSLENIIAKKLSPDIPLFVQDDDGPQDLRGNVFRRPIRRSRDGDMLLKLIPNDLWSDESFCEMAVNHIGSCIKYIKDDILIKNVHLIHSAIKYDAWFLKHVQHLFTFLDADDLETILLLALETYEETLLYVPNEFWKSRSFVKKVLKINVKYLLLISALHDHDISWDTDNNDSNNNETKTNAKTFKKSTNVLNDVEIAMICVKENGPMIQYFSSSIRDNEEVVRCSLSNTNGLALAYASDRLRCQSSIVSLACRTCDDNVGKFAFGDGSGSSLCHSNFIATPPMPFGFGAGPNGNHIPVVDEFCNKKCIKHIEHPLQYVDQSILNNSIFLSSLIDYYLPYDIHRTIVLTFCVRRNQNTFDIRRKNVGNCKAALRLILDYSRDRFSLRSKIFKFSYKACNLLKDRIQYETMKQRDEMKLKLKFQKFNSNLNHVPGNESQIRKKLLDGFMYTKKHYKTTCVCISRVECLPWEYYLNNYT